MAEIIVAAIIASGVTQTVATIRQGRAAQAQAETESEIAAYNARLAERQAEEERIAAVEEAKRFAAEGEAMTARQRVLFAKARVEPSKGTPLSVVAKTAAELEADRLNILREGAISSAQRRAEASIYRLRGSAARARGKAAVRGSRLAAVGTILSTVGTAGLAGKKLEAF